jgi:hypothetical protein
MKRIAMFAVAIFLMASTAMAAGDGRNFGIQTPPDWTPSDSEDVQPDVTVEAWFEENGQVITDGRFIGPLQPGVVRDVDASVFRGTGRTITFQATAERTGVPETRVQAVPVTYTFPVFPLAPPTLLTP